MKNLKSFSDLASAIGLKCKTPLVATVKPIIDNVLMVSADIANVVELIAHPTIENFISYKKIVSISNYLCFTAEEDSTIGLTNNGDNAPVIYYSSDGENFTQWDYSDITLNAGDKVYMYGDNPSGFTPSYSKRSTFTMGSGKISASGNIMSLISIDCPNTIPCDYCFEDLFYDCASLTSAPELPATTLTSSCYEFMFGYCENLTSAPELPATTLAEECYRCMFRGCSSLTTAPELLATTLVTDCYGLMFLSCSSLNYIKAMFTTEPTAKTYTESWLNGVASTGTFVKNSAATWNITGVNGIPSGWTVETADE